MPNNVSNKLKIQCEDSAIMAKIKKMLLKENNEKESNFTMEILLPRSMAFADGERYDLDWNRAVWGTKWDAYNTSFKESGNTITFFYSTAWRPNRDWVHVLCDYVDHLVGYGWEEKKFKLSIEHRYSDYPGNFGGIVEWKPRNEFQYTHYNSYTEYLNVHDKEGFNMIMEAEERMKTEQQIQCLKLPVE